MRINEIDLYKLHSNPEGLNHHADKNLVPELMTRGRFMTAVVFPKLEQMLGVPKRQMVGIHDEKIERIHGQPKLAHFLYSVYPMNSGEELPGSTKFKFSVGQFTIPFIKEPCAWVWLSTYDRYETMTDHGISFYVSKQTLQKLKDGFTY